MKKLGLSIEWIFLIFCFLVTGIGVLFVFKPPANNYPKLIKWSEESSQELILQNAFKRMFPVISESSTIKIVSDKNLLITLENIANIIELTTRIPARIESPGKTTIVLQANKQKSTTLEISVDKQDINNIKPENLFDSQNLEKVLKKIKSTQRTSNYIFSLYQTGKNDYRLHVIEF